MYNFINNINGKKSSYPRNFNNTRNLSSIPRSNNIIHEAKTVSLFSQPYLDTINQCYKNIVVLNLKPQGPLNELVKYVNFPPLSEFKEPRQSRSCGYAIMSLNEYNNCDLMDVDEVPDLISYLVSNGYKVDTSITKMFNGSDIRFHTDTGNKLICFITYLG
jgi:hypothetical protein